ncbi:MAG: hypothetical protein PHE25_05255 [Candidatus Gracilibacteria bacterium]|nr:hypothetical protein [Candidatus Gracilibacteria bacterium]
MTESEIKSKEIEEKKINNPSEDYCVKRDTAKWLCELKTAIGFGKEKKAYEQIKELLKAQKRLSDEAKTENENQVLMVIKSPNNKYHLIEIPKSFDKKQKLNVNIDGKNLTIEAIPKTNGYNTEYKITNGNSERKQIAILFTIINPEWKKQKKAVDELKAKQIELERQKVNLETKIANDRAKIELEKKKKSKTKKSNIAKIKATISANIESLTKTKKELEKIDQLLEKENQKLNELNKLIDFPYSPYNKAYDTDEIRTNGYGYLRNGLKKEFDKLNQVKSVVGGKDKLMVGEAFDYRAALVFNIVERMDYKVYQGKKKEEIEKIMTGQIEKALTTIAINQDGAFNWQRNEDSKALGLGQVLPGTYKSFKNKYHNVFPENYDFEKGAKDHSTVFRLQGLHLNDESIRLPKWIKDNWKEIIKDKKAKLGLYSLLAAGYNGPAGNIFNDAKLGDKYDIKTLYPENIEKKVNSRVFETQTYVMKFVFVWEYLKRTYRDFD